MEKATEMTGGRFFISEKSENLPLIYSEIDKLEKSSLPILAQPKQKQLSKPLDLDAPFIAIALAFMALSILLECLWIRKIP
jgi:Ca-activated chloride channel family protein